MTFCFSREPLERLLDARFLGDWKHLREGLFEVSERRAQRACLELAMHIRFLDEDEGLSDYLRQMQGATTFGRLIMRDGAERDLFLRDVANKIIHASAVSWNLQSPEEPLLTCIGEDAERWVRAEIAIVSLASFCGQLMH